MALRLAGAWLVLALWGGQEAWALTITFDNTPTTASVTFSDVVPGGAFGPALDFGTVALDGGVIGLAITPSDQAATTLPNFYATTDFQTLADGSSLPGVISGAFTAPATAVTLDVGNGNVFPADFTLTAFDGAAVVASQTISLPEFASAAGFVGQLSVSAPSITGFTVTSSHPGGSKLFSVDTVVVTLVPEPAVGFLTLSGLGVVWARRRRL